jgi:hypothetical protein
MVVHDVKVNHVGASGDNIAHFFTKAGEIGRENAGGDTVCGHDDVRVRWITGEQGKRYFTPARIRWFL